MKPILVFISLLLVSVNSYSQEEETVHYAKKYLDINIKSLNKYAKRIERQQQSLLRRLERKERKLERQLKRNDSAAYVAYTSQSLSYDSIRKLLSPDSNTLVSRADRRVNKVTDSLKAVHSFLQSKTTALGASNAGGQYQNQIDDVQSRLNYQQYINGLIDQRSNSLKNLGGNATSKVPAFTGIEKTVFYGKSKMNVFREMADEPSKAEEAALECLRGSNGFDAVFESRNSSGAMAKGHSLEDLERIGFQTRRVTNRELKDQLGTGTASIQEKMAQQVQDFGGLQRLDGPIKTGSEKLSASSSQLQQVKLTIDQLGTGLERPKWERNKLRGLPFSRRIDKGFTWQSARASYDKTIPATVEFAGYASYKQTSRLAYGVGLACSLGLGSSWNNIRFSFEGLSLRSFATWEGIYGFSAYGGYEGRFMSRHYTQLELVGDADGRNTLGRDAILLGVSKTYRINSSRNGAIQFLYDIAWKQKGLNSPIIIRVVTSSK